MKFHRIIRDTGFALALLLLISALGLQAQSAPKASAKPETYFFLVFSDPATGREAEYNKFYDEQHGPDVTSIPGFISGRRYVMADEQLRRVPLIKPKYLILYRVETADPVWVRDEIARRLKSGVTRQSSSAVNFKMYTYRKFTPEQTGVGGDQPSAKPGPKNEYVQIVFGDATPGQDDDFNHWYNTVHEPELLAVPGFTKGDRGIISPVQFTHTDEGPTQSKYIAIFELRSSAIQAVFDDNAKLTKVPPSFDKERTFGYTMRAVGPPMLGDKIRAERAKHP